MAQGGTGDIATGGSSWPGAQDTRQTFVNSPNAVADTNTRIDAEVVNDALQWCLNIMSTLGDDPRVGSASVQAALESIKTRLDALEA